MNEVLTLWDYCLESNHWEVVKSEQHIRHKTLDINIMQEYVFNYNIFFNTHNEKGFRVKIIEKSLHIDDQIRLLTMFIDIYGKKTNADQSHFLL
jgi:ribosome biogenesis GTPase A